MTGRFNQQRLDAWVATSNTDRHTSRWTCPPPPSGTTPAHAARSPPSRTRADPTGSTARSQPSAWCACPDNRFPSAATARERCDIHVGNGILQLWIGNELLRTVQRVSTGPSVTGRPLGGALTSIRTSPESSSPPPFLPELHAPLTPAPSAEPLFVPLVRIVVEGVF